MCEPVKPVRIAFPENKLNNKEISVVVFDLGNVLIPFDYDLIIKKLNAISEGLGDKFYKLYKENYHLHREFERWEISTEGFINTMLDWLDNKVTAEEFCKLYSDIFTVNEQTTSLLPNLKEKYKLVLLSNTNYIHQKYGWEQYDFLKHFDKLILSHEVGAIKPEEKIYKAVEDFTGQPAGAHIFIDDIAEYAQGARDMGWSAIQFTGYGDLIIELKKAGITF